MAGPSVLEDVFVQPQMKNIYVLEQASKPKPPQDEQDESPAGNAVAVENVNYLKSKEARLKLEKAIVLQKQITDELEKQGEKISKIKESSINLYRYADASQDVSVKIEDESSIFPSLGSVFKGVRRWWNTNGRAQREVQQIEDKKGRKIEGVDVVEAFSDTLQEEYIPGENKTEKELAAILNSIRKVSSEGKNQLEMVEAQIEDISDIKRVGEYSKRIIDETEKLLRRK